MATPGLGRYDVVVSCHCAESATGDRSVWRRYVRNILRLLVPGGLFATAALRRCRACRVGSHRFACADIDEHDLAGVRFESGVEPRHLQLEVQRVGLHERLGHDGIVLAAAAVPRPANARSVPPRCAGDPGAGHASGHSTPSLTGVAGLPPSLRI